MKYLILLLAVFACAVQAEIKEITFTWDAPTTRENGDVLAVTNLSEYTIYFESGEVLAVITGGGTTQHVDSLDLSSGQRVCFQITAKDTDGVESARSDITEDACYTAPIVPPGPPTTFRAVFMIQ